MSVRERFGALRNLPPFLSLVLHTSPRLSAGLIGCRLARAFLPVVTLFVGKLIIDEVVRLAAAGPAHAGLRESLLGGHLDRVISLVSLELALAVLSDVLGRAVALMDALLSEKLSNATSIRLM